MDRILTTHVGSLPRSDDLLSLLVRRERGEEVDRARFDALLGAGMEDVVRKQSESRIDVAGDGELPRIGFANYVKDRMTGFGGEAQRGRRSDYDDFPKFAELKLMKGGANASQIAKSATTFPIPEAQGAVVYDAELTQAKQELAVFAEALARTRAEGRTFADTFVTAASPGIVSTMMLRSAENAAYADDAAYLADLAEQLRPEYEYIVSEGHILQIDAPDLAGERALLYRDRPLSEFLERIELHVATLNDALVNIPRDRVRMHVCWGNSESPHVTDVELEPLLPVIYEAKVGAISCAGANPRHQHDYKMFAKHPLPDGMNLIPGVIDVTYNYMEHPEVVADRICRYAEAVGDPRRITASTDCGFSTFAGYVMVAEDVAWAKLAVLAEGAELATARLFG